LKFIYEQTYVLQNLCWLTLWAKWAIAQGPALKGAPHLLKGLLKIKEKGGKKKKKEKK